MDTKPKEDPDKTSMGETTAGETQQKYWKFRLYDRLPVSVDTMDKIILGVTALILVLIVLGIFL